MINQKNQNSGFHLIGFIFAEFIFSGAIVSIAVSGGILRFSLVLTAILVIATFALLARAFYRQIPTLLGYGDLASQKTAQTSQELKNTKNNIGHLVSSERIHIKI